MVATTERPTGAPYDAVPEELRQQAQWVVYYRKRLKKCDRFGRPKFDKVPVNPATLELASTTDPDTWGSFDQAVTALQASRGRFTGIGYVFSADDPYTGIDLDAVIDPDTSEIAPWALAVVRQFASYTEVSISGTGLHIIVRGVWGNAWKKRDGFEVYDRERFFTISGARSPDAPATIEARQDELDQLHAEHAPPASPSRPRPPEGEPNVSMDTFPAGGAGVSSRYARRLEHLLASDGGRWGRVLAGDYADYPGEDGQPDRSRARQAVISAMHKRHMPPAEITAALASSVLYTSTVEDKGQKHADYLVAREYANARSRYTPFPDDPGAPPRAVAHRAGEISLTTAAAAADETPTAAAFSPIGDIEPEAEGNAGLVAQIVALKDRIAFLEERHAKILTVLSDQYRSPGEKIALVKLIEHAVLSKNRMADGAVKVQFGGNSGLAKAWGCSPKRLGEMTQRFHDEGIIERIEGDVPTIITSKRGQPVQVPTVFIRVPDGDELAALERAIDLPRSPTEQPKCGQGSKPRHPCPDHPKARIVRRTLWICEECGQQVDDPVEVILAPPALPRAPEDALAAGAYDAWLDALTDERGSFKEPHAEAGPGSDADPPVIDHTFQERTACAEPEPEPLPPDLNMLRTWAGQLVRQAGYPPLRVPAWGIDIAGGLDPWGQFLWPADEEQLRAVMVPLGRLVEGGGP